MPWSVSQEEREAAAYIARAIFSGRLPPEFTEQELNMTAILPPSTFGNVSLVTPLQLLTAGLVESAGSDRYRLSEKLVELIVGEEEPVAQNYGVISQSNQYIELDHTSQQYKDAVSAFERAIKEFKADHKLENILGIDKRAIEHIFDAGREFINDYRILVDDAIRYIIDPLKRVYDKCKDYAIAGVVYATVQRAYDLLLKLFELD